jgi:hypothetical protein
MIDRIPNRVGWALFLAALLVSLLVVCPAIDEPATAQTDINQLKALIDARLAPLWRHILTRQTIHYQMYDKYFQGLSTHGDIPADGAEVLLDLHGASPTDQPTNWLDFLGDDLPESLPMALVIDTYDGPGGTGFVASVYVFANGNLYSRSKGIGPERARLTKSWHRVTQHTPG